MIGMSDKAHPHISPAFLAKLSSEPGVYRMLNSEGEVLYVGKAGDLKKRVLSYFSKQNITAKTRALLSQVVSVEVSVTQSETEALLLESNLIKALLPKYNVLLRDDKSYPYIHVSQHTFPRMELYRSKKKPQSGEFYGPYPSTGAVRETLITIQKIFKIRNCRDSFFSARTRPCLQYDIKRCSAPCTAYITPKAYQQSLQDARRFLQGKSQQILDELARRMDQAVARLAFEEAAMLRDQIKSLRLVQEQQGIVLLRGEADVIAIEARPGFACIYCVTVRQGEILTSQSFFPSVPTSSFTGAAEDEFALWEQVFEAFVRFYYVDNPERIPPLIISHEPIQQLNLIQTLLTDLRGKICQIQINPRGKKARWLTYAKNNLRLAVKTHLAASATIKKRVQDLQVLLKLSKPITRMECFDISHTQGQATVASCVVFDAQGPCKSAYRRFNIENITPGDDYAAMEQALTRHFKQLLEKQDLPDVLVIDGGKGQVAVAQRVLASLNGSVVTVVGIAKGPTRKAGWEKLILATQTTETTLAADSPALHLLQHIRDEAHRFAISAHRKKRQKASLESSLESIEGVGPKRRQALLRRFGGLRELAKASVEEIAKVQGVSKQLAAKIFDFLQGNK